MFLNLPKPPVFATLEGERLQHRKQPLAASFRLFTKLGFDERVVGQITARAKAARLEVGVIPHV